MLDIAPYTDMALLTDGLVVASRAGTWGDQWRCHKQDGKVTIYDPLNMICSSLTTWKAFYNLHNDGQILSINL